MGARGKALDRVAVLDRAGNARFWCDSRGVFGGFWRDYWLFGGVGATPSRRLACGCPPLVSQDAECDSVLCVLLVVVLSRSPWSPFSTARVKRRGKTVRGPDARESVCSVHTTMAPRRRPREGVAEQVTRQEAGDGRHLSRRSLCHRTHTVVLLHRTLHLR
ncbi:hypothetical protein Taro_031586 [Colocasia esculenta]|uniref:Uncharacterized protein n=1 Tax=Colocasia esculenta TaxID=4460 RepID=A0A843W3K4_COLES|nr:hypothetical protein [Colocasia esculenta]